MHLEQKTNRQRIGVFGKGTDYKSAPAVLYHTFSTNNQFIQSANTTDNLMDYNNGIHLHKFQWDFIHDPQAMIVWAQDDEEAASEENTPFIEILSVSENFGPGANDLKIDYKVDRGYVSNENELYVTLLISYNDLAYQAATYRKILKNINEGNINWDGSFRELIDTNSESNEGNYNLPPEERSDVEIKYTLKYEDSPFKIKLRLYNAQNQPSTSIAEVDHEGSINPLFKEWDECERDDIISLVQGGFVGYINWKEKYESDGIDGNVLEILSEKINEYNFLGHKILVHDKFWSDVLKPINDKLVDKIEIEPIENYFSMRPINGNSQYLSPHAYGCAIDFEPFSNPQIDYNQDRPIFYLIKKSTGINFDSSVESMSSEEHMQANNKFIEVFSTTTPEELFNNFKLIDKYLNDKESYKLNNLEESFKSDLSELNSYYNEFLLSIENESSNEILVENKLDVLNKINNIKNKTDYLNEILPNYINTIIYNSTSIITIDNIKNNIIKDMLGEISKYENEIYKTGDNTYSVNINSFAMPQKIELESFVINFDMSSLLSEIKSFIDDIPTAIQYFYEEDEDKVKNKSDLISRININESQFNDYKIAAFGYALKVRIEKGQFTGGSSNTILQRGFFNIPIEIIETFKEIEEKAENANLDERTGEPLNIIEWGGEYQSKKDWMHIGIRQQACKSFISNEYNEW